MFRIFRGFLFICAISPPPAQLQSALYVSEDN